jgi:hypothetical protein
MRIRCACGGSIRDHTDYLPYLGRLIPDQDWFDTFAVVDEAIRQAAAGELSVDDAQWQARTAFLGPVRMVYECLECGRLLVDDRERKLQFYVPEDREASRDILRSKDRKPGAD